MKILIKAESGDFLSIKEAAYAEKKIDWWDDSNRDRFICCDCYAATEIFEHLSLAGSDVVLDDGTINKENDIFDVKIFIGSSFVKDKKNSGRDGSISSQFKNNSWDIYLWGDSFRGSLSAAYHWLELLGFRWFLPDDKGNIIPDEIIFKESKIDLNYDYQTRACYNEFIDDDNPGFLLWASRNRMNMLRVNVFKNPHLVKKFGLAIMGGGHEIFYRYLNPAAIPDIEDGRTYFDLHPDWFALLNSKRSNRNENLRADEGYYTGDNICTSNKAGISELASNMIESFNSGDYKNLEYLNLWAYDNGLWCECENCKNTGNLSRRMLMLAYEINSNFLEAYNRGLMKRRIKLVVPVYHETLEPPDSPLPEDFDYEHIIATFFPIERCYAHNIDDEKCTESNSFLIKDYNGWNKDKGSNYKGEIFIGEYYNVSSFASLPFLFTKTMENDIPYYYETGTRHLYYMHISARRWGMLCVTNNLLAALMRDRSLNCEHYLDEMQMLLFPTHWELMKKFHNILEQASSNSKYLKHYQFSSNGKKVSLNGQIVKKEKFPLNHCKFDIRADTPESSISFVETIELFEKASEIIRSVSKKSKGIEKERISDELMRFEYGYKVMQFIYNYVQLRTAYDNSENDDVKIFFNKTEKLRRELIEITEPIAEMKYECPWYVNAYNATWHSKSYEELRNKLI